MAAVLHRRLITFGLACDVFGGSERAKLNLWPSQSFNPSSVL